MQEPDFYGDGIFKLVPVWGQMRKCFWWLCWKIMILQRYKRATFSVALTFHSILWRRYPYSLNIIPIQYWCHWMSLRNHHNISDSSNILDEAHTRLTVTRLNTCVSTLHFLAQSTTKTYNTSAAFICTSMSARRHVDESVFNELLNNQAGVILRCL
jgi:hypothetical protein